MWGWFGGNSAAKKEAPKKAIVDLRDQLGMLQKRERYLEQQISEHEAIARKNINTNKNSMLFPFLLHIFFLSFSTSLRGAG